MPPLPLNRLRAGEIVGELICQPNSQGPSTMITEQPVLYKNSIYGIRRVPLEDNNMRINNLRDRELFIIK